MAHFVGLDVSVKETSVCVVDDTGKVMLRAQSTDRAGRYHRAAELDRRELRPDRDRGRSVVAVAGQCVDGS